MHSSRARHWPVIISRSGTFGRPASAFSTSAAKAGVSSSRIRRYRPMMPIGPAIMNGMRQPQDTRSSADSSAVIRVTRPAPPT